MRSMPHEPNVEVLTLAAERIRGCLERLENGGFSRTLADQWILRGMLEYGEEKPLVEVVPSLRRGVHEIRRYFERATSATPWEVWDYFLYAVAVGDRATADFLRKLPEPNWGRLTGPALGWLVMGVRTVMAIYEGEELSMTRSLRDLQVAVLEMPLPDGLGEDAAEVVNGTQLLHAVYRKDGAAFDRVVRERMKFREESFRRHGRNSPLGLMDLHTLGICRMARDRGIRIAVEHPYLPTGLLDLP